MKLAIQAVRVNKDKGEDGCIETFAHNRKDIQPFEPCDIEELIKKLKIPIDKRGYYHKNDKDITDCDKYSWLVKDLEDFKDYVLSRYCYVTLICGEADEAVEPRSEDDVPHLCRYCQFWGEHDMDKDVLDDREVYAECSCQGIVEKDKDNSFLPSPGCDEDGYTIETDEFIGDVAICCDGKFRTTQNFGCVHWKEIERSE